MLEEYRKIIYKNEDEKKEVIENCINRVLEMYSESTKEEIIESITQDKSDVLNPEFIFELLMTEGTMLFDIAVKKFGEKIWNSGMTLDKKCKKLCPFGDMCEQCYVEIDEKHFCYGQLLQLEINEETLKQISIEKQVKLMKPNGEVLIDLSSSDYDDQCLSAYFFEYEMFPMWFGDYGGYGKNKITGKNVISHL